MGRAEARGLYPLTSVQEGALDLHRASSGSAQARALRWLCELRAHHRATAAPLPPSLTVITGAGAASLKSIASGVDGFSIIIGIVMLCFYTKSVSTLVCFAHVLVRVGPALAGDGRQRGEGGGGGPPQSAAPTLRPQHAQQGCDRITI
eukprot:912244-Prorocentrum_minimum.AAC.2